MKLGDIVKRIEKRISLSWAESWDNPGLAVGDPCADVSRIALALDAAPEVVEAAALAGCGMLVTHHPIIFRPMKSIVFNAPAPRTVALAIQRGVALYSAHTNWDSSPEGVNVSLARALELADAAPLAAPAVKNGAWGMGAVGSFMAPIAIEDCLSLLRERWRLSTCTGYGDAGRLVSRVALGGGACGDMWPLAVEAGADLFITSDVSYHHRNDALNMGLNLIVTDHGETERVSLPALAAMIEEVSGLPVEILDEPPLRRIN